MSAARTGRPIPQLVVAMKERAIQAAARIRGMASGLSPIQCDVLARYARDQYRRHQVSPARAVSNAAALCRDMTRDLGGAR